MLDILSDLGPNDKRTQWNRDDAGIVNVNSLELRK